LGRQPSAGIGQLLDHAQRHQFGQPLQGAQVGHHTDVDFLDAEKRVGRGIADTAGGHHVHGAADAAALDRGDHGDAQRLQPGKYRLHVGQQVEDGGPPLGRAVRSSIAISPPKVSRAVPALKC
jgi:hypothetical protein